MKKSFLSLLLVCILVAPVLAGEVVFTSPAGGEAWVIGTQHTIIYSLPQAVGYHMVRLHRNGQTLGFIRYTNFPTNAGQVISYPWTVGKVTDDNGNIIWAPCGSGYIISAGISSGSGDSKPFTIACDFSGLALLKKIYYSLPANFSGCPQCIILDLAALREELIKLHEPVAVGLYRRGTMVANLGQIGKGRGFAAKLQVTLGSEALAAMNRGEEFELRLLNGRNQLLYSQSIRLMAASLINPNIKQIQKR